MYKPFRSSEAGRTLSLKGQQQSISIIGLNIKQSGAQKKSGASIPVRSALSFNVPFGGAKGSRHVDKSRDFEHYVLKLTLNFHFI